MHDIKSTFDKIIPIIKSYSCNLLNIDGNITRPGPKPTFSDLNVIALTITAEILNLDSENYLFKIICSQGESTIFPNIISRSQFNVRRRNLKNCLEFIRINIVKDLTESEDSFIIDSMPIEICKFVRAKRSNICREYFQTAPEFGYCASQKSTYFGYKLHTVCSINGVITSFDLSKANVNDIKYLQDIKYQYSNCLIIGDKGYNGFGAQLELFNLNKIRVETPMKKNQINFKPFPFTLRKCRKRIETVYSQLCDQFLIRRNYAKSFNGFATRIVSKISTYTILQYLNKFVHDKPIGLVKHAAL